MQDNSLLKVFVVILNFNGAKTLQNCLAAVFQSDYPGLEVIVVDNNSTDGSLEEARIKYSKAHFIKNSKNVGFSKGNNVGIRYALEKFADLVFILNNDTVIEKTTISDLVRTASMNKRIGITSPVILGSDNNSIWFAGGKIDWNKMRTVHETEKLSSLPYSTQYLSGCAMLVKKEVFKEIGLFDERFFLYYEDADFSLRARKAGFDLIVDPSAHIRHLEQSNSENTSKTYWLVLSGMLFFNIHASFVRKLWLYLYTALRKMKNLSDISFGKNEKALQVRRAYLDFKKTI